MIQDVSYGTGELQAQIGLDIIKLKMCRQRQTYSYRSRSIKQSNSITINESKIKTRRSSKAGSFRKIPLEIKIPFKLVSSIKVLESTKLTPNTNLLKKSSLKVLEHNSRQNRIQLVDILLDIHPFFNKLHPNIAEAIILLSKPKQFYKGQIILPGPFINPGPQKMSPSQIYTKDGLGFIIYGKVQVSNDKFFYSHQLANSGTLFENRMIGRDDKMNYYATILDDTCIFWLSKDSYEVIRKQCFVSLDLKYKFGQFQNLLKLNMVTKKVAQKEELGVW